MTQELEKWMDELSNRASSTRETYRIMWSLFCSFLGKTSEQILLERKADMKKEDRREQVRYERELKHFMVHLESEGYSISTRQVAWASVKSFFDTNYYPLQPRRGDYPTGQSLGHRAFTKAELKKLVELKEMSLRSKLIVFLLKDTGLRVGDLVRLKYGEISKQLEAGEDFISLNITTEKRKVRATTFIGDETIKFLKEYLDYRRKGTRNIEPEVITKDSWLIRHTEKFDKTTRTTISSLISQYIEKIGLKDELSAHSLRKFTQTQLESAGVQPNWVKQIIGHKLEGSEGSYSRPTVEMLRVAYIKAYDALRINPRVLTNEDVAELVSENERLKNRLIAIETQQEEIKKQFIAEREAILNDYMKKLKEELGIAGIKRKKR